MAIARGLRARQPRAAARSLVLMIAVSAGVLAVVSTFGANAASAVTVGATWAGVAVLVVLAVVVRRTEPGRLDGAGVFVAVGIAGVAMVCVLNWITEDTSAGAQAFLAFPVLWVASHLRRAAVAVVTAAAVVANAVVVPLLLPLETALSDVLLTGVVLTVVASMLERAGSVQERLVEALEQQATVDTLTGLVNRRVFDDALAVALDGRRSGPGEGTALMLLDVDSFKQINDVHGHPVGDDALVHLAGIIRRQIRAGDAVLSRLGGDELAVLLPGCSADVAVDRAGALLESVLSTPLTLPDGSLLAMSVSVGVAHSGGHTPGMREFYAAADRALYRAKRGGRGRVEVAPV
ncbi:GGDEF domain-containing protein [Geodermatophilus sp. FMUSA9-8]|uniref:GGDEF domain-containing protein n=1 Tax=Geodermatophilus sp. FMUSA9-8 TaxID=3120155 RepID=UPI00300B6B87